MPEQIVSVGLEIKNQQVHEELKEIISSMKGFRVQNSRRPETCDIVILEIGDDLKKEFQFMKELQGPGTVREFFLTSSRKEPEILLQALRAGAREFFAQPVNKEEVRDAFAKFLLRNETLFSDKAKCKRGKIINVIGAKGGVGTTTVAVNLATSLKSLQSVKSVALIDMNLVFGEVPIFLELQPVFNWGEVTRNISRLDPTYLMSVLSKHSSGVYVLPSPPRLDGTNTTVTPDIIERLLHLMQAEFDFIVIDSGQSLDDVSLRILELSDTALLVSILSLPCLINVKKLMETFWNLGCPWEDRIKIIVNRYEKKSVISLKEGEEGMKKKIFWVIPNDYQTTMSAINQGKALSAVAAQAEITRNFRELALTFTKDAAKTEKKENKEKKSGFWGLKF